MGKDIDDFTQKENNRKDEYELDKSSPHWQGQPNTKSEKGRLKHVGKPIFS